jgi:putative membrane protein
MNLKITQRINLALVLALAFHLIGWFGIIYHSDWIMESSAINLLLMFLLLLFTEEKLTEKFWGSFICLFSMGMISEMIGTNTGFLFGDYQYKSTLGPSIFNVPWIIGINWFLVVYGSYSIVCVIAEKWFPNDMGKPILRIFAIAIDTALLTCFFDWIMEPVAVYLDFWSWTDGIIPNYNYLCWFIISLMMALLLAVFKKTPNSFSIHLFWIQILFFLSLRNLT